MLGGLCDVTSPNTEGCDPMYAKCYEGVSSQNMPLNGIRFAFQSQTGTSDYDPAVPQITPVTNISACLSTVFYYFKEIFKDPFT